MNSDDLLNSLNNLKKNLETLEESVFYGNVEEKKTCNQFVETKNLLGKLKLVEQCQDTVVQVDIRGEILYVSRATIDDCLFENILSDEIKNNLSEIAFIDIERKFFNTLLNMLRHFNRTLLNNRTPDNFRIYVRSDIAEDIATLEILNFFKNGTDVLAKIEFIRY